MEMKIYKELLLLALTYAVTINECHLQEVSNNHKPEQHSLKAHNEEFHLPRHVTPNSYKLSLTPFFDKGIFRGRVEINISCHEPTDTIMLHVHRNLEATLDGWTVRSMGVFQKITDRSLLGKMCQSHHNPRMPECDFSHSIQIARHERNEDEDLFLIILQRKLAKGFIYHFYMNFLGNINTLEHEGFYRTNYNVSGSEEERWFAFLNLENKNARKVFPCFDEPNFKARIKLNIGLNISLSAISTMPLQSTNTIKNIPDVKLDNFELSPPMTLGSFGLFIFDPTHIKPLATGMIDNVAIHGFGDPKLTSSFPSMMKDVVACLAVLKKQFGFTFPLPILNLVALPSQPAKGDFWGLIAFSEKRLTDQSFNSPLFYLLPRQWIGHMVTPDLQSAPVNDGLQSYLAFASLMDSEEKDEITENVYSWPSVLAVDLYNMFPEEKWFRVLQNTGMWRMLNYTLTERTFKLGIYNFLHLRAFQMYNEADIYGALDNQAWLDNRLSETKSVQDIAKSWNGKLTFPIVTVTRNYEEFSATIEQHPFISARYQNVTDDLYKHLFWIPITYMEGNSYFTDEKFVTWMTDKQMTIKNLRDAFLFIIINPEQVGMFLVNYDKTNWDLLSQYLLVSATTESSALMLPEITRSKLLFDAIFLALNDELDFGTALNMTLFMRYETSPTLWTIMDEIMFHLVRKLHDTPVFDQFLIYCRYLYAPAYKYFKNRELKSPLEVLPEMVEKIAAETGYQPAVDDVIPHFRETLRNNSWLQFPYTCAVLRWSDEDWEHMLQYVLNSLPDNESSDINYFADLLWCNRKPKNLIRILQLVFVDVKYTFSNKNVKNILYAIHDYDVLMKFILHHWNEIKSRYGNNQELWDLLFEEATKDVKTEEGLKLVFQLYTDYQKELGSAKGIVEKSMKIIQHNLDSKYMFVNDVTKWLDLQYPTFSELSF